MPDEAECRAVFEEMVERFHQAPSPSPIWLEEETVGGLAAAEAVAVMYGWTNRIIGPVRPPSDSTRPGLRSRPHPCCAPWSST